MEWLLWAFFVHIVGFLAGKEGGSLLILAIAELHGSQSEKAKQWPIGMNVLLFALYEIISVLRAVQLVVIARIICGPISPLQKVAQ